MDSAGAWESSEFEGFGALLIMEKSMETTTLVSFRDNGKENRNYHII